MFSPDESHHSGSRARARQPVERCRPGLATHGTSINDVQLDTASWTPRLDIRHPERNMRGYLSRRTVVASVFGALTLAGIVVLALGVLESIAMAGVFIVVTVTGLVAFVALMQRWRAASIASLQGDDRIVAIVFDEGIVLQGGLPIAWREISKAEVRRVQRTRRGAADMASRAIMQADGVSNVWTTVSFDLADWPTIRARATTKQLRRPLTRPMLGLSASALLDLGAVPDEQTQHVLAAVMQQTQRHAIEVT